MDNNGAINLLIAITKRAYDDYVRGLKYKKHCEDVGRKPLESETMKNFKSAEIFLTGTKMGEYLKEQAEKEERRKHNRVYGL